jgi:hypothetical protein
MRENAEVNLANTNNMDEEEELHNLKNVFQTALIFI